MLQNTFVHIPGVGKTTEQRLWACGIRSWDDISGAASAKLGRRLTSRLNEFIPLSRNAFNSKNTSFFSRLTAVGEAWRLFGAFPNNCVYLDIETTGLSPVFNTITLVGLYDGDSYQVFVDGHNLHELPAALEKYQIVVTFNGAQFDLPFIRSAFPNINLPQVHIDLRWLVRRLGYAGGLKQVEPKFGIKRPVKLRDIDGFEATVLWSRYLRGDATALQLLIDYNRQDVLSLKQIMERSYRQMRRHTATFLKSRSEKPTHNALPPAPSISSAIALEATHDKILPTLVSKAQALRRGARIVGIDLTGSEKRASGWALLDGTRATTALVRSDAELIQKTIDAAPDIVSIDSPLSLPGGKSSPQECRRANLPIYRACELALKRMGISVFWCLLPSMEMLTLRGMRLARELRAHGLYVIESYPGAAQDLLRIPRKGTSLDELRWGLFRAGVEGDFLSERASHDEVDAITSALVGTFFQAHEHVALGNVTEDYLIVPRAPQIDYRTMNSILLGLGLDALDVDLYGRARVA